MERLIMKTEAQKIREIMESLLTAGKIDFQEVWGRALSKEKPQVSPALLQRSIYEQLLGLHKVANKNGLYDAADWLRDQLDKMERRLARSPKT